MFAVIVTVRNKLPNHVTKKPSGREFFSLIKYKEGSSNANATLLSRSHL